MAVNAIPRSIVKMGLSGIRLPLSIAEQLGVRSGIDVAGFPPVAVYDSVEARAKQILGRLLHDEQLVSEGERQESAARHRNGSEWLSTQADEVRESADQRLEQRVERAEEAREDVERRAAERQAQIQREEEEAKREARERARKREAAVRQAAKAREKAVEAKERQAELARIQAESEALDKESQALEAEKVVTAIDDHLENRKASRRNDSS